VLEETPVGDVWGVGPAYGKLLVSAGITTARQLRDADRRWIRQRMTIVGARIVEELRGISCLPMERCPQARKSVTCSRSFGVLVESLVELCEAVTAYTTKAAERLRRARLAAGVVTVFSSTNRFSADPQYSNSLTFELAYATDSTEELLAWTRRALERIYRSGYRYKKAGVMLNHLTPADELTTRLFGDERFEKSRRLMKAVADWSRVIPDMGRPEEVILNQLKPWTRSTASSDGTQFGSARRDRVASGRRSACGARGAIRPASMKCSR
jgi:DNA polymerase V